MAGIDLIVSRESAKALERCHFHAHIAAGQIRSAAASSKQRVAGEQRIAADKAYAARGVTRGRKYLELKSRCFYDIAIVVVLAALGILNFMPLMPGS